MTPEGDHLAAGLASDPLDGNWQPDEWWTTTNMGEALPGVLTPLTWSFSGTALERAVRRTFVAIGAAPKSFVVQPADQREWGLGIFHGRTAVNVQFLGRLADSMPGTSGAAMAEQWFGAVPDGFDSKPSRRRYHVVAGRLPLVSVTAAKKGRKNLQQAHSWWAGEVAQIGSRSLSEAQALLRSAAVRYEDVVTDHISAQMAAVQPLYEAVQKLALAAGAPELAHRLLAGQGAHAEEVVVKDMWRVSREQMTLSHFLLAHGCHAPLDGELSSVAWREDASSVEGLVARYRELADDDAPDRQARRHAEQREAALKELLGRLPAVRRRGAAIVVGLATKATPLRGIGKEAGLKAMDVGRAAARRAGLHLSEAGVLTEPDDAFYLTVEELATATVGVSMREIVRERRGLREAHAKLLLPDFWRGRPQPLEQQAVEERQAGLHLSGHGASGGVVEALARVVLDPGEADVEPGEILVAPFTDPGWAPLMFLAGGLVVDIGGLQSHAAVVARELGIPCVMGTGDGTRRLRTGDLCRLDGDAGTVELLALADAVPASES